MITVMIHKAKHIKSQIANYLNIVKEQIYTEVASLKAMGRVTAEPIAYENRLDSEYREYKVSEVWGSLFDCGWFHITGAVPKDKNIVGKKIALMLDFNGEGCLFDSDGCPIRGITNVSSTYDYKLGMPGKRIFNYIDSAVGGEQVDIWIDAGCNDLFGNFTGDGKIQTLSICTVNSLARDLYYDMFVLNDMLESMHSCGEENPQYYSILYSVQSAINELSNFTDDEFIEARKFTQKELSKKGGTPSLTFNAVGHAHIDLAWLWPIRETRRKAARTFSTQLELLDKNPNYVFGASQAQLYQWVKEDYPKLYDKVKAAVKQGRWELQGGTWVEMDTNIPSGESLVRQFLYGQRFYREEFGETMKALWLPDVFGYSACIPQLMKKSGCDYFSTIKLSWSKVNKFPYHTFNWIGLDGSEVLVHMPPEDTYGSAALPSSFKKAATDYQEQGLCDRALCLFGISDGGGGCGPEHMERINRVKNLSGLYPVEQTKSIDFFEKIAINKHTYSSYKGELYVEAHQGTLTTQAKSKLYNRRLENLLHDVELICCIAYLKNRFEYPKSALETIWKEFLLYQFHDIIPGSSIKRVYEESIERYQQLEHQLNKIKEAGLNTVVEEKEIALFNQLPWEVQTIADDGDIVSTITVPRFGFAKISDSIKLTENITINQNCIESNLLSIEFDTDGLISSVFDKCAGREIVKTGEHLNQLKIFTDVGDAWDFSINYRDKKCEEFKLKSATIIKKSGRVIRRSEYSYNNSTILQDIIVTEGSKIIDFVTRVNWNEKDKMLRAEFPLSLVSDTVNCDIQFGHVKRTQLDNNSIDYAKIEVTAHKWIDISENNYGVALLNDCKYGYYAKNNNLSINLLRSQNYPGVFADIGEHEFKYAIYLHDGNIYQSDVEKRAYEYNNPPVLSDGIGCVPFIAETDKHNIIIETVKMCEDGDDIIIRLYENKGTGTRCKIKLNDIFTACTLVNLIEDEITPIEIVDSYIALDFHAFEVNTIKLKRK